jgi:hypothetical protein
MDALEESESWRRVTCYSYERRKSRRHSKLCVEGQSFSGKIRKEK